MSLSAYHFKIKCGLLHRLGRISKDELFLGTVAQAYSLPCTLEPQGISSNFSFICSSKTAVQYIYEKIYLLNTRFFDFCLSIYFIGLKTKDDRKSAVLILMRMSIHLSLSMFFRDSYQ